MAAAKLISRSKPFLAAQSFHQSLNDPLHFLIQTVLWLDKKISKNIPGGDGVEKIKETQSSWFQSAESICLPLIKQLY